MEQNQPRSFFVDPPKIIVDALRGLAHSFRLEVVSLLATKGDLSLSELQRFTNRSSNYVANHIHKLEVGGVVQNYLQRQENRADFSFYEITELGKSMLSGVRHIRRGPNLSLPELLKIIQSNHRFTILHMLAQVHEKRSGDGLSFLRLREEMGLEGSVLTSHLKKLKIGRLITNFYKKSPSTKEYSFYKVSQTGHDVIEKITRAYNAFITSEG